MMELIDTSASIDVLNLGNRAKNGLKADGILTVQQLVEKRGVDLLKLPNFGRLTLNEVIEKLAFYGLELSGEPKISKPQMPQMTLRDYFAAKAMQADMAAGVHENEFAWSAARSYKMAGAMLKARAA
jgi:hypothetical protein